MSRLRKKLLSELKLITHVSMLEKKECRKNGYQGTLRYISFVQSTRVFNITVTGMVRIIHLRLYLQGSCQDTPVLIFTNDDKYNVDVVTEHGASTIAHCTPQTSTMMLPVAAHRQALLSGQRRHGFVVEAPAAFHLVLLWWLWCPDLLVSNAYVITRERRGAWVGSVGLEIPHTYQATHPNTGFSWASFKRIPSVTCVALRRCDQITCNHRMHCHLNPGFEQFKLKSVCMRIGAKSSTEA